MKSILVHIQFPILNSKDMDLKKINKRMFMNKKEESKIFEAKHNPN
jgi:hypothetical protein